MTEFNNQVYLKHNEFPSKPLSGLNNFGTIDAFSNNSRRDDASFNDVGKELDWEQPSANGTQISGETPYHDSKAPRLGIDMDKLKKRMHKKNYSLNNHDNIKHA